MERWRSESFCGLALILIKTSEMFSAFQKFFLEMFGGHFIVTILLFSRTKNKQFLPNCFSRKLVVLNKVFGGLILHVQNYWAEIWLVTNNLSFTICKVPLNKGTVIRIKFALRISNTKWPPELNVLTFPLSLE